MPGLTRQAPEGSALRKGSAGSLHGMEVPELEQGSPEPAEVPPLDKSLASPEEVGFCSAERGSAVRGKVMELHGIFQELKMPLGMQGLKHTKGHCLKEEWRSFPWGEEGLLGKVLCYLHAQREMSSVGDAMFPSGHRCVSLRHGVCCCHFWGGKGKMLLRIFPLSLAVSPALRRQVHRH